MPMNKVFAESEPKREAIDALAGAVMIEFGAPWCGYCQGAQPLIEAAFAANPPVHHIKIEDGPGRRLGRSFRIKRWPTLVFMRNGQEISRLVRPADAETIVDAINGITGE